MKKLETTCYLSLKGNTKEEIISFLGQNYHRTSTKDTLIYIIHKTWFNPKGNALHIEFNEEGKADTFFIQKNNDQEK